MAWLRKFRRWCAKPRLLHEEIGDWVTAALETKTIEELDTFVDTCPLWYRLEYRRARQGDIFIAFLESDASADWMRGVFALLKDYDWLSPELEADIHAHIALLKSATGFDADVEDVDKTKKGTQMAEDIPTPSTTTIAIHPSVGEDNNSQTPISAILALGPDDIFSLNGKLPWDCPEDMKFFKETTMCHTVVMGYNTFKSLGFKPLPDRLNIVVLDNGSDLDTMPELTPVHSWGGVVAETKLLVYVNEAEQRDKAYYENIVEFSRRKTPTGKKIWVIGGASMLGAMLEYKLIDELVVTRIPTQYMKERKEPLHWCQYFRVSSYTEDMVFDETVSISPDDRYLSYTRWYKPVHVELTARQIQHLEVLGVNAYNDARSGYGPKRFREGSVEEVVYNLMYKAGSSRLGTHIPGAG